MKKLLAMIFLALTLIGNLYADIEKNLDKLEQLFESGKITKKEYRKAKKILYEMENVNNHRKKEKNQNKILRVNTYKDSSEKYEKNEIVFNDYRI